MVRGGISSSKRNHSFRNAEINHTWINLQGICIALPRKDRSLFGIIFLSEDISLNFDLTCSFVILRSTTSHYLIFKIRRIHRIWKTSSLCRKSWFKSQDLQPQRSKFMDITKYM